MKTVSGKVTSTIPISLSEAAKTLSKFAASHNGASHSVSLYLQRASDSFNQLVQLHETLKPPQKEEHSTHGVKVEKNREVGVKTEDIVEGSRENKKSKNLGQEKTPEAESKKRIKSSSRTDIVKDEHIPNGSLENTKSKNLGKEKTPQAESKKRIKGSSKVDVGKNEDIPNGSLENKKSTNLNKEETPQAESRKKIKSSLKDDVVKDQKLVTHVQSVDIGKGETAKSVIDKSVKSEPGFDEVKEDGTGKKKRKKRKGGVSESEGKMEEDLGFREEEEKNSMVQDAGENAGSAEQSKKKKSKKRR